MATGSFRISQLGTPTVLSANDRIVVLTNPGTTIANTQTITLPNFLNSIGGIMPGPYSNDASANTGGVAVKGIYYDTSGIVRIRLS